MKKLSFILFLFGLSCITFSAFPQISVQMLNLTAYDLIYEPLSDRIYASLPGLNGTDGNSIGIINPHSCTLENTVYMGPDPSMLAISDDGDYIYTGFLSSPTVRRFNVRSQSAGLEFPVGEHTFYGPMFAWDIEVMPDHPETIAISRILGGVNSGNYGGVAIYDNGVMRDLVTNFYQNHNQIEFIDGSTLITYNNSNTGFDLRKLVISDTAFVELWGINNLISGFYVDFIYSGGRVYSTNGIIGDVAAVPYVAGIFAGGVGPVIYDKYYNLVCYAATYNGEILLKRFSPESFLIQNEFSISQNIGYPLSLTGCGKDCYAFSTSGDRIVIVKVNSLGLSTPDLTAKILVYPNPATDAITIKAEAEILSVRITDISGRILLNVDYPENNTINMSGFEKGIYLIEITMVNNHIEFRKIFKQ